MVTQVILAFLVGQALVAILDILAQVVGQE